MTEAINKALDLVPYDSKTTQLATTPPEQDEQATNDVTFARESLYSAESAASEAVEDMIAIARQSQHPKAYEVLNSVIKTKADIAMGIADLQLKKQRIAKGQNQPSSDDGQTINNNLFVGSTAELQQLLSKLKGNQ